MMATWHARHGSTMLISVLTTTFNRRDTFLPQCLASVRGQVGDAFACEHIVIDNCSTDGTWAFLREAAASDPHVRPVQTSASRGLAHALNRGSRQRGTGAVLRRR